MLDRKREVYIRVDNVATIVDILKEIKSLEDELKELFAEYDKYNMEENKLFENWSSYMDDIISKLDHITL